MLTTQDIPGKPGGKKNYCRQSRQREARENSKMLPFLKRMNRMVIILTVLQRDPPSRIRNLKD